MQLLNNEAWDVPARSAFEHTPAAEVSPDFLAIEAAASRDVSRSGMVSRWTRGLVIAFAASAITASAEMRVGSDFPNLASFKFEGQLPADLTGKIILVDFWASWCAPCKKSFPVLDELLKRFGDRGLVVIGVNEDQKKSDMDHFLKENKVSFSVVRDAGPDGKKLVDQVDVSAMPSSFIIDGTGKVRFVHKGFQGAETKKQYEQEIESLLKK